MWVHALPGCQQANEQQCLPNGFVVQHTGLLKWHLITATEAPFYKRLIAFFESTFSSLSFCVAYGLAVTVTALHIQITG